MAIKILPPAVRDDPGRRARFAREARVLASLNHPHIGAIYGLEEAGGLAALVMELVEGDDLSQCIEPGGLPIVRALTLARQIAEALEAAHGQGVVHRDLKPANIKVRRDGTVKVLDFGLARALAPAATDTTSTALPTEAGVVLGTPPYMSPEQARGEPAEQQADIWAFGVVLYELLTGISPFRRPTAAETLASVLGTRPDESRLPPDTPASIRRLVRRCLAKDRMHRLHHIGDARLDLEEALAAPTADAVPDAPGAVVTRGRVRWAGGVLALALLAGLAVWLNVPPAVSPMRAVYGLSIRLTGGLTDNAWPVWSGDGLRVFYASDRGGPYFDVYSKAIDGSTTERVEFEGPGGQWPTSVTRDGRVLVLENHAGRRQDLSLLTPGQSDRLDPLLDSEFNEWLGEVSPDGNWLAYESDESGGRVEIFVSPYPGVKAFRRQVSTGGGRYPLWNLDGSELTYVDPDGGFMAASVELSPGFRLLKVEKLFDWYRPYALVSGRNYDISPIDGRFLMSRPAAEGPDTIRISVVQHWLEELRERIPRGSR